jgi:membrane protein implicated in regulation of membrane protease activity
MRVGAHVAWWAVIAVLAGVFVLSLWSDVWEAYVSLLGLALVGYAWALWRSRRPHHRP